MNQCRQLNKLIWRHRLGVKIITAQNRSFINLHNHLAKVKDSTYIEDGYVKRFMKAIGWKNKTHTKLKLSGFFLYEGIPRTVPYSEWFTRCELSDTFASWFIVTELHVWLLMVRCMAEDVTNCPNEKADNKDGQLIRNCIVEAMWADVANRIKLLEGVNSTLARTQVNELSEQFQAAIIGYDEGLSDDRVLAAAIWRRFYGMSDNITAGHIEKIVKFVRKQMFSLDNASSEQIRSAQNVTWLNISA